MADTSPFTECSGAWKWTPAGNNTVFATHLHDAENSRAREYHAAVARSWCALSSVTAVTAATAASKRTTTTSPVRLLFSHMHPAQAADGQVGITVAVAPSLGRKNLKAVGIVQLEAGQLERQHKAARDVRAMADLLLKGLSNV